MRIGRSLAIVLVAATVLPCWGCGLAPHDFRKMQHPAPLVRAREVGLGGRAPDSQVVPALVARLDDEDPVVRLAANEELRKRTGRDFGYVPWSSPEERAGAIARWRSWLTAPAMPAGSIRPPDSPPRSVASPPSRAERRPARRRREKAQPSPQPKPTTPTPPATENPPS